MKQKKWCLIFRKNRNGHGLPLSRWRSRTGKRGQQESRLTVTFDWRSAVRFVDKEDALFYLANLQPKYGNQVESMYPRKIETAIRNHFKSRSLRKVRIYDREYAKFLLKEVTALSGWSSDGP
jgi:hypothetical protein